MFQTKKRYTLLLHSYRKTIPEIISRVSAKISAFSWAKMGFHRSEVQRSAHKFVPPVLGEMFGHFGSTLGGGVCVLGGTWGNDWVLWGHLGVLGGMLEYLGECLCTLEVFEDTWGGVVVLWGYLGYLGDA